MHTEHLICSLCEQKESMGMVVAHLLFLPLHILLSPVNQFSKVLNTIYFISSAILGIPYNYCCVRESGTEVTCTALYSNFW